MPERRRVGILGGGQLAWMLALAAERLGISCRVLDPSGVAAAGRICEFVEAPYDDPDALARLAARCDVVTYEFENVPAAAATRLTSLGARVLPDPSALAIAQDRLAEKRLFRSLGIATAPFTTVDSDADAEHAFEQLGKAIVKTRRFGYDGKGQIHVSSSNEARTAFRALGAVPAIAEGVVAFESEISVIATRSATGDVRVFPLCENSHEGGILRRTLAPARASKPVIEEAASLARAVAEALDYVGSIAIELFLVDDALIANELAPRVHNSGHWTIEGAETSQFENHIRAICDLPLGSAALRAPSAMLNVIGRWPSRAELLGVPGASLHDYGKTERPGRKLGHLTITAPDTASLTARVRTLESLLV